MRVSAIPLLVIVNLAAAPGLAADPPLASGRDPGGTAVAVIAPGFDYTQPQLARALARDGEGEAISWDAIDNDRLPFASEPGGTETAIAAATKGSVRLIVVRAAIADPASLARAISFVTATPARIVVIPLDAGSRTSLDVLIAATKRFEALVFVTSLVAPTGDERHKAEAAGNLILLEVGARPQIAAETIASAFGCGQSELPTAASGSERSQEILRRLERPVTRCEHKQPPTD